MGAGGVRGMLVTLGAIQGGVVDLSMVGMFTLGVMLVFIAFGMFILYFNQNFLSNLQNVKRTFTAAGLVSLVVGTNILLG
jgi:predicted membrane channel-forming protein YqfA (hemolysin III family)